MGLLQKLFGDASAKEVKKMEAVAERVIALKEELGLPEKTDEELHSVKDSREERLLMTSCRRLLRYVEKPQGVQSEWSISLFRLSAEWFFTKEEFGSTTTLI